VIEEAKDGLPCAPLFFKKVALTLRRPQGLKTGDSEARRTGLGGEAAGKSEPKLVIETKCELGY
jgi:hypothetical protein